MGRTFLLSAEALLDAQFSEAPGSAWLWHPALLCVPTAGALPRVPADGAISPCHSGVCGGTVSQMGISAHLAEMDFFPSSQISPSPSG